MENRPEDRIAALEKELAAVRAEMQNFAFTVSHDLRAPLRHIVSFAQLVQEDAGPLLTQEVQGFLSTMTDSARHMGSLLDALLALSRVGSVPIHRVAVPLLPLVREVCAELSIKFSPRVVDCRIPAHLPCVLADPVLLRQVVFHVLDNAFKFTARRENAVVEVVTHETTPDRRILVEVVDNGAGFNPTQQEKLFKVFGRLHSQRDFEGLGMGLMMTRKALERMGGEVQCHGTPDAGCRLSLTLPVLAASAT